MACLAGLACAGAVHAQGYTVPAETTFTWDGAMNLQCGDLIVNGTLNANGATFQSVNKIIIGAGGVLNAGNASFDAAQSNVQNNGTFNRGTSTFVPSPTCGGSNVPTEPRAATPVPANSPLGLALMGLLLGAAPLARRWLGKRRQA
ncbi:hypothetical protein GCM10027082_26040 [Comamonas humi]